MVNTRGQGYNVFVLCTFYRIFTNLPLEENSALTHDECVICKFITPPDLYAKRIIALSYLVAILPASKNRYANGSAGAPVGLNELNNVFIFHLKLLPSALPPRGIAPKVSGLNSVL